MKFRYPVLILAFIVLIGGVIAGCVNSGGGYSSSANPAVSGTIPAYPASTSMIPASNSQIPPQTVTIELTAAKMAFDQSVITVPAGTAVVVNFHNREDAGSSQVTGIAHNFAVYDSPAAIRTIFSGEIITGGEDASYRFTAPSIPGTYAFRCDLHPTLMSGKFIVE
jgi:plastocyanin